MFADADEWIGDEDRSWYFSFENICEILEINPGYLRRGMQCWRHRAGAAAGHAMPLLPQSPTASEAPLRAVG